MYYRRYNLAWMSIGFFVAALGCGGNTGKEMKRDSAANGPVASSGSQPINADSEQADARKAVAELLTPRRQAAFQDLQSWWKSNQPEVDKFQGSRVGQVDRYQVDGEWITVVFTGARGQRRGGVCLIAADGRQIPIFQSDNYLDETGEFTDVNGDGIPEMVHVTPMAESVSDNPKEYMQATGVEILPITREQIPLLRIVFDVRESLYGTIWRWKLANNKSGAKDIIIERRDSGRWTEQARFVWSKTKSKFEGPTGSNEQGFIANAGNIEQTRINQFIKGSMQPGHR